MLSSNSAGAIEAPAERTKCLQSSNAGPMLSTENPRGESEEFSPPICRADEYFTQLTALADQLESLAIIAKSEQSNGAVTRLPLG